MGSQRTHRDAELARVAERQFGAFTHAQAVRAGFTASPRVQSSGNAQVLAPAAHRGVPRWSGSRLTSRSRSAVELPGHARRDH
jgi:hypothetical protein